VVFVHLVEQLAEWGYKLIDCQVSSAHLVSFGAQEINRETFQSLLTKLCKAKPGDRAWMK